MNLCLHLGLNSFHFDEIFHKQGKNLFYTIRETLFTTPFILTRKWKIRQSLFSLVLHSFILTWIENRKFQICTVNSDLKVCCHWEMKTFQTFYKIKCKCTSKQPSSFFHQTWILTRKFTVHRVNLSLSVLISPLFLEQTILRCVSFKKHI